MTIRVLLCAAMILAAAAHVPGDAAAQGKASAAEAHVLSAFATGADPLAIAENVQAGPALRAQLGVDTDSRGIYEWVAARTAGNRPRVTLLSPADAVRHASIGVNSADPLMRVEAGDAAFLVQYSAAQKNVTFVEQLSAPSASAPLLKPAAPLAALPPPPAPAPRAAPVVKPAPPRTGPRGECVVKPVMSEDDIWNCSGPQPAAVPAPPALPVVTPEPAAPAPAVAPAPVVAAVPAAPQTGECVIKPVMSDAELRNCASVQRTSAPVLETPAAPVAAVAATARMAAPTSSRDCIIKPVMSDEDLRNCANARGSMAPAPTTERSAPAAAVATRAPSAPRDCVIKPVMSDEDLRNCASARGSTAPSPTVVETSVPAAAAPTRASSAPRECIVKPVMSDEDLRNCANAKGSTPRTTPVVAETEAPAAAPQLRAAPAPSAPKECIIRPVMSDDELRACGIRR